MNKTQFQNLYSWSDKHYKKLNLSFLFLALIIFSINIYDIKNFIVDDTFIGARYADNLASGYGFSWNYDNHHVFGFSNYLSIVLIALGIKFGFDPVILSKIISVIASAISIIIVGYLVKLVTDNNFKYYFITSILFAVIPEGWLHAISGMETTLFMMLVILSSYFYIAFLKKKNVVYPLIIFLILSIFSRYEGLLFTIGIIMHQLYLRLGLKKLSPGLRNIMFLVIPFVFIICLLLWNNYYFGQILPNPFYVKSSKTVYDIIVNGYYIFRFLVFLSPFVILSIINIKNNIKNVTTSYFIIQTIIFIIPYFFISQIMNYNHRFYFPISPLIIVLGITSFLIIKQKFQSESKLLIVTSITIAFLILYPLNSYSEIKETAYSVATNLEKAHISIGKTLGSFSELKNNVLAVLHDAGAIPYYSHWKTFDYVLNDNYSAKHGFDVKYFYEQNPSVIVMTFVQKPSIYKIDSTPKEDIIKYLIELQHNPNLVKILSDPNFKNYRLISVYEYAINYNLYVFVREDLVTDYPELITALRLKSTFDNF